LNAMLSLSQSRPWPEALEALTGSKRMDATAILDYFAPLSKWRDEQLAGQQVGWGSLRIIAAGSASPRAGIHG
jgi:peptidyl-dipeptidase A